MVWGSPNGGARRPIVEAESENESSDETFDASNPLCLSTRPPFHAASRALFAEASNSPAPQQESRTPGPIGSARPNLPPQPSLKHRRSRMRVRASPHCVYTIYIWLILTTATVKECLYQAVPLVWRREWPGRCAAPTGLLNIYQLWNSCVRVNIYTNRNGVSTPDL